MYLHGLRESPSLFRYSFSELLQMDFISSTCCNPFAICKTSLGFIFFKGILLTSLSTSPDCLMNWDILFLSSIDLIKNSTSNKRSSILLISVRGSTINRFSNLAPIGETVLSKTLSKELFPSTPPSNSRLRMVNLSIHKWSALSILCKEVMCCRFGCSVSFK